MKYLIGLFALTLFGCQNETLKVSVSNQSGMELDSVIVSGLGTLKFTDVKNNSELSGLLDYSKSKSKTDGAYKIKVYKKDGNRDQQFGYYSNGTPINEGFSFVILKDSINIEQY